MPIRKLTPLWELGRLAEAGEFAGAAAVVEQFGSLKRALALVRRVTGVAEWDAIRQRRTEDLLVYMALASLRPAWTMVPYFDIRHSLLDIGDSVEPLGVLALGNGQCLKSKNKMSNVQQGMSNVEVRSNEGCGRAYLGEVEGANIVKIHRRSGKISYLVYPDFESDPHPALLRCIRLSLRTPV